MSTFAKCVLCLNYIPFSENQTFANNCQLPYTYISPILVQEYSLLPCLVRNFYLVSSINDTDLVLKIKKIFRLINKDRRIIKTVLLI